MAPNNAANGVEAPRFEGVVRPYSDEDVKKLQGSLKIEHTLALEGSKKLWVRLLSCHWRASYCMLAYVVVCLKGSCSSSSKSCGKLHCHANMHVMPYQRV
jgi:isocitrate lyase